MIPGVAENLPGVIGWAYAVHSTRSPGNGWAKIVFTDQRVSGYWTGEPYLLPHRERYRAWTEAAPREVVCSEMSGTFEPPDAASFIDVPFPPLAGIRLRLGSGGGADPPVTDLSVFDDEAGFATFDSPEG